MQQGFFSFIVLNCNFDDQLVPNFHRHILCLCWDTPSGKTGLWQLPEVVSAFRTALPGLEREIWGNTFYKYSTKSMVIKTYLARSTAAIHIVNYFG